MYNLSGRIDSNNAAEWEKKLLEEKPTEIDASGLEYISSAGLRVLLKLRKTVGEVNVINVKPEVYEVFEVTGFDKLLSVKKAFREISLTGLEVIGRGGNGTVYRIDADTIVKMYKPDYSLDIIEREQKYAKTAFISGIPSVIAYDVVKSGDCYGVVFEAMNSDTLGHAMSSDMEHLDDYVDKYVELAKTLHSVEIEGDDIMSLKDFLRKRVDSDKMREYCEQSEIDVLLDIIDSMKEYRTLVHGDFHPGNIMIQNGELMLIDMGEATLGPPIYDVATVFRDLLSGPKSNPETIEMSVGLKPQVAMAVGDKFLRKYSGAQTEEQYQGYLKTLQLVYAFNVVCFLPDLPHKEYAAPIVNNLLRGVVIPNAAAIKGILSR